MPANPPRIPHESVAPHLRKDVSSAQISQSFSPKLRGEGGVMPKQAIAAIVLLFGLFAGTPAFSQSTYATVSGTVEDSAGALIPGVTIVATNTQTGVVTTVLTNEAGAYNIASLLP